MKRDGLSFAARLAAWFALVVIGLSIALFLAAYFLLYRAVQEQDREVIRAQLEVYRAWYAEGGRKAFGGAIQSRGHRPQCVLRAPHLPAAAGHCREPAKWSE